MTPRPMTPISVAPKPQPSPITLDFCIWLHRNADRLIAGLQDEPVAIPAPAQAQAAAAGKRTCSLCDFPVHGHGLCRTHYGRMRRAQKVGA